MKKVVSKGNSILVGSTSITKEEFNTMLNNGLLMTLCFCLETGELCWEKAPEQSFMDDCADFTVYLVEDPKHRIEKRFAPLPVNNQLPYMFTECSIPMSDDTRAELEAFKAGLTEEDFQDEPEIYFELADKSGDVMKRGTCQVSFLDRLTAWAENIGGSFYTEAIC
jgi:hypothetical protein